jgi:hypothetical protein
VAAIRVRKALIKGHAISPTELKMLKQVSMLNHVAHPGHFIFILNPLRQAARFVKTASESCRRTLSTLLIDKM